MIFPRSSCYFPLGQDISCAWKPFRNCRECRMPIKWDILPKHVTPKSSALAANSHVRLKAMDLTSKSKPVWMWSHMGQLLLSWIKCQLPPGDTCELTAPLVWNRRGMMAKDVRRELFSPFKHVYVCDTLTRFVQPELSVKPHSNKILISLLFPEVVAQEVRNWDWRQLGHNSHLLVCAAVCT